MDAATPRRRRLKYVFFGTLVALVLAIAAIIAAPAIISAREKARMTELLATCRKFHMLIQQAALDEASLEDSPSILPADAGVKTAHEYLDRFVKGNYLTPAEADKINEMLLIGNLSASDPGGTIFLKLKPGAMKSGTIIFRKAGDGAVLQGRQMASIPGDPPRNPPYLVTEP